MSKSNSLLTILTTMIFFVLCTVPSLYAQEIGTDEFTLEEITITAEKRTENLQTIPTSVTALQGADLKEMGKITTAQILESVPNVQFREGEGPNPNGNIAIRGMQRTQQSGGDNDNNPSSTATYVDEVYQGIGGNYDINRVEVLRGPQGTLYGRSATGGVVAFHTNDPTLDEFGGDLSAEYGTASLVNLEAALNVPVSDKFALRAAGHFIQRDGYIDAEGGKTRTEEGRIKALFQPSDKLNMILSISAAEQKDNGGGKTPVLLSPSEIDYTGTPTAVVEGTEHQSRQASLTVNYDLDGSTLTYIGAYHDYDDSGDTTPETMRGFTQMHRVTNPTNSFHTEEIRWTSDSEGPLKWLIGSNFYEARYNETDMAYQLSAEGDTNPASFNAPVYGTTIIKTTKNYGLFTENTYDFSDALHVTAGLRFDKTKIVESMVFHFNKYLDDQLNPLNPADWAVFTLKNKTNDYNNVTYKVRLEYDLTPESLLYAVTATGFLPGNFSVAAQSVSDGPGQPVTDVNFIIKPFDQQRLTSYEVGTKNRFLDNKLQLNGAAFYYKYQGYQEAVNIAASGPPSYAVVSVPLRMFGVEIESEFLITAYDKLSFSAGWLDAKITDFPVIAGIGDTHDYFQLEQLPGNARLKASLGYDHSFIFSDGSTLAPRAQLRYTGGYYLQQLSATNLALEDYNFDVKAYDHQSAYVLGDISLTWTSSDSRYSVSGYVRNVTDEEYKTNIAVPALVGNTGVEYVSDTTVDVGDPRTFGVVLKVKF